MILVFACKWCAYRSADATGSLKIEYPQEVIILRVPCSGSVSSEDVVRAVERGFRVIVAGCPVNECHYKRGNVAAMNRVRMLKIILPKFGVDPSRVEFMSFSSSDAEKFARKMKEFADEGWKS